MMSTAIMHQSALYEFGDLLLKVSLFYLLIIYCTHVSAYTVNAKRNYYLLVSMISSYKHYIFINNRLYVFLNDII